MAVSSDAVRRHLIAREKARDAKLDRERADLHTRVAEAVLAVAPAHRVARSILFGSLIWGGFHEHSDVDLLVWGLKGAGPDDLAADLGAKLGRPVDVVPAESTPPSAAQRNKIEHFAGPAADSLPPDARWPTLAVALHAYFGALESAFARIARTLEGHPISLRDGSKAAALGVVLTVLGCRAPGVASMSDAAADTGSPADSLTSDDGSRKPDGSVEAGQPPSGGGPDDYWLEKIGRGDPQRAAVCARGRNDLVTERLCDPDQRVGSLTALYAALGLRSGSFNLSIASNSSGLTFRTTSALNPRSFLSTLRLGENRSVKTFEPSNTIVVAFSRGDQLAELLRTTVNGTN